MAWSIYATWREGGVDALADAPSRGNRSLRFYQESFLFFLVILGVLYALYGGVATPSETAAVGALLCLGLAIVIYKMTDLSLVWVMLLDATKESVMILFIIGAAGVFSYMPSSLFITQACEWIGTLMNRWVLMPLREPISFGCRFFPASCGCDLDGSANIDAHHFGCRIRPLLVCSCFDDQHGDRLDSPLLA